MVDASRSNLGVLQAGGTQLPWYDHSSELPWEGFQSWCRALHGQGRLWEAQKILRLLLPVLLPEDATRLCEHFMEKVDDTNHHESVLITDLSTANACTRYLVNGRENSGDSEILAKAKAWSSKAHTLAAKIQNDGLQEAKGRPFFESKMADLEIDLFSKPDQISATKEAYGELCTAASEVLDMSVSAESLWRIHMLNHELGIEDPSNLERLRELEVDVMKDALGYAYHNHDTMQNSPQTQEHTGPRPLKADTNFGSRRVRPQLPTYTKARSQKSHHGPQPEPQELYSKKALSVEKPLVPQGIPGQAEVPIWGSQRVPSSVNLTMLQAYEFSIPADCTHWKRLHEIMKDLKSIGIDDVWLPPGCKAIDQNNNGYEIYDLYDLGEFHQRFSKATKWGTREELEKLSLEAERLHVRLIWDTIINHKAGADQKETVLASRLSRDSVTSQHEAKAPVCFEFPGRSGKYSSMEYHWYHFAAFTSSWQTGQELYRILGNRNDSSPSNIRNRRGYSQNPLAFLDFGHPEVREDVKNWGKWLCQSTSIQGFKFEGLQDLQEDFVKEFIMDISSAQFFFGELWAAERHEMISYLSRMGYLIHLLDIPLMYNLCEISRSPGSDLRNVFVGTLVERCPNNAVTFVTLADTQPGWEHGDVDPERIRISEFFKPLAYSLILLRAEGYPCTSYGDLLDTSGVHPSRPACDGRLPDLVLARKLYAYGEQEDYFTSPNCIGRIPRYPLLLSPPLPALLPSAIFQFRKISVFQNIF